jgi:hypothetical protein
MQFLKVGEQDYINLAHVKRVQHGVSEDGRSALVLYLSDDADDCTEDSIACAKLTQRESNQFRKWLDDNTIDLG